MSDDTLSELENVLEEASVLSKLHALTQAEGKLEELVRAVQSSGETLTVQTSDTLGKLRTDIRNGTETVSRNLEIVASRIENLGAVAQAQQDAIDALTALVEQLINLIGEQIKERAGLKLEEEAERAGIALAPAFTPPARLDLYPSASRLCDYPNAKIVVFGLQKSGNTWLLSLLADIFDLTPYFNVHDTTQYNTPAVISTHDPLSVSLRSRTDFVHGVCLIRDLRDMVASYFHYMQTDSFQIAVPKAQYGDIETFYFDWFLSRMAKAHRYETFWSEYAEAGVPPLRFERLVVDPQSELERLFRRWGEPVAREKIELAIGQNTFSILKKEGKKIGSTKIESTHFRRGGIGTYKDELPQKVINDINSRFGHVLLRWGYDVP